MTPKQIQAKLVKLYGKERMIRDEIEALRDECPHVNLEGKYKGNTGNWCPQDDSYWIDAYCNDCGKRWMIDSEEDFDEYRSFSGKKII